MLNSYVFLQHNICAGTIFFLNMYSAHKINIDVSKRHARRFVANETAIDIAGCSIELQDFSCVSSLQGRSCNNLPISVNASVEKNNNPGLNKNSDRNIVSYFVLDNNHYQYRNNIEKCNDNRSQSPNVNNDEAFRNAIAIWSVKYNICHNACNALLKILQEHTLCNFFKDARSLLKTPRQTEILKICGGKFFYWGLSDIIANMLLKYDTKHTDLFLNIDDLPLSKSSNASLWPILCSNTMHNDVYIVGAYFGHKKPENSNIFLQPLVNDLINLINDGYFHNNNIIKISLFGLII